MENRAALLASNGFACLALDYLTPRITLETGKMVGDDYFEVRRKCRRWRHTLGVFVCIDVMRTIKSGLTLGSLTFAQTLKVQTSAAVSPLAF